MIIDAHHHLWDPAIADYPWLTDELASSGAGSVRRTSLPYCKSLKSRGRSSCRRARASRRHRTSWRLQQSTRSYRGVVGWVDLTDPAIGEVLGALRDGPGGDRLVGIRHQVHDEPEPDGSP
jgi:L-fuconolactonase